MEKMFFKVLKVLFIIDLLMMVLLIRVPELFTAGFCETIIHNFILPQATIALITFFSMFSSSKE
jgi:hypothetical protein